MRDAIARILREHGRSQPRRKPRPPVRSLAAEKLTWPALGLLQVDVKDLSDLAGYRELISFWLPRCPFTARIVPEGGIWLAFSAENDSTYALLFADHLPTQVTAAEWSSKTWSSGRTTAASSGEAGTGADCLP